MDRAAPDPLQAIRDRIDAIDEAMHRLLIDRAAVIAELIRVKGTSAPGGAFRPEREADMMRRMALRHQGALPLTTVEHIWREIISTFTAMQAPFGIAVGPAADPLAMRDAVRFYFGFAIPLTDCRSSAAAVERIVASGRDVALVPADSDERWWSALAEDAGPKILAKLPFIEVPGRPADLVAYVVGPALQDRAMTDIRVFSMPMLPEAEGAIAAEGGRIVARADGEILVELPIAATLLDIGKALGRPIPGIRYLGGFFQPIRHVADRTA